MTAGLLEAVRNLLDRRSPKIDDEEISLRMGAYHALNFFLKHPDLLEGTIALSRLHRLDRFEFGICPEELPAVSFR
ncbi:MULTISPECIES: hypothetical protein [Desulfococcus]|nr:hypothetical protein [Desulfococcus multivorans]MDX9819371.1 hypothetical protein [Desulfococcus multivorans]